MRQLCETEIVASKEFIVDAKPMTHSFLTPENYFLIETCPLKIRKSWIFDVRSAKTKKSIAFVQSEFIECGLEIARERRERESFFRDFFELPAGKILPCTAEICWMHAGQPCEIYCRPSVALRAEVRLSSRNSLLRTGTSRQLLTPRKVYFEKCTANASLLAVRRKTFHASSLCNFVHYASNG